MKIYYFGELIEDTEDPSVKLAYQKQTALDFDAEPDTECEKVTGGNSVFDAIGDLLDEIDLNVDVYKPFRFQKQI